MPVFSVFLRPSVRELDRGAESAPPSGARSAEYPSGARVNLKNEMFEPFELLKPADDLRTRTSKNAFERNWFLREKEK